MGSLDFCLRLFCSKWRTSTKLGVLPSCQGNHLASFIRMVGGVVQFENSHVLCRAVSNSRFYGNASDSIQTQIIGQIGFLFNRGASVGPFYWHLLFYQSVAVRVEIKNLSARSQCGVWNPFKSHRMSDQFGQLVSRRFSNRSLGAV